MKPKPLSFKTLLVCTLFPLLTSWGVDHVTKLLASNLSQGGPISFFGPIGFTYLQNHGIITGLYSDSAPLLREVSLATAGAFLLFIYFMVQYLLPTRSLAFRAGLSFLMGGILGNVSDRMINGYVTDFITIGSAGHITPIFNCADAFQWVGYLLLIYAMTWKGKSFWRAEELRGSYWINWDFQLSYCMKLVGCGAGFAMVAGAFTYTYFKIVLDQFLPGNSGEAARILISYSGTFVLVTLTFLILLFILGMILSHRIAGPIYALERFMNDVEKGDPPPLNLRRKDEFRNLEEIAKRLQELVKK